MSILCIKTNLYLKKGLRYMHKKYKNAHIISIYTAIIYSSSAILLRSKLFRLNWVINLKFSFLKLGVGKALEMLFARLEILTN